jgi:DNA-binding GntR family transcriptional regulator
MSKAARAAARRRPRFGERAAAAAQNGGIPLVATWSEAGQTLAMRLRAQLSDDIVRGLLAPGVALDEMALARRFGVSRTPVREAIRLLVASGLVEARPHRSAVVARPDESQLSAMCETLRELEGLCAGMAAERATGRELARLEATNSRLLFFAAGGDPQGYHELNEEFHDQIYAAAHNPYLGKLASETRARITPFSRAQFRTTGRMAKSHGEHQRVLRAIAGRDAAAAAAAMRKHIGQVHHAYHGYSRAL